MRWMQEVGFALANSSLLPPPPETLIVHDYSVSTSKTATAVDALHKLPCVQTGVCLHIDVQERGRDRSESRKWITDAKQNCVSVRMCVHVGWGGGVIGNRSQLSVYQLSSQLTGSHRPSVLPGNLLRV